MLLWLVRRQARARGLDESFSTPSSFLSCDNLSDKYCLDVALSTTGAKTVTVVTLAGVILALPDASSLFLLFVVRPLPLHLFWASVFILKTGLLF
jgi:hypothetical protein